MKINRNIHLKGYSKQSSSSISSHLGENCMILSQHRNIDSEYVQIRSGVYYFIQIVNYLILIFTICIGVVVVVTVWYVDLQLPMQSVPITTKVVSLNPVHCKVHSIQHYVIKFVSDLRRSVVFSGYFGFLHQ
jgi:hypothetical protein